MFRNMTGLSQPTSYELAILRGLQRKTLYQGTVTAKVKDGRRRANKMAKASRRANRGVR